jgi:hypothetical protein
MYSVWYMRRRSGPKSSSASPHTAFAPAWRQSCWTRACPWIRFRSFSGTRTQIYAETSLQGMRTTTSARSGEELNARQLKLNASPSGWTYPGQHVESVNFRIAVSRNRRNWPVRCRMPRVRCAALRTYTGPSTLPANKTGSLRFHSGVSGCFRQKLANR